MSQMPRLIHGLWVSVEASSPEAGFISASIRICTNRCWAPLFSVGTKAAPDHLVWGISVTDVTEQHDCVDNQVRLGPTRPGSVF